MTTNCIPWDCGVTTSDGVPCVSSTYLSRGILPSMTICVTVSWSGSRNAHESVQSSAWRVGACKLPSRVADVGADIVSTSARFSKRIDAGHVAAAGLSETLTDPIRPMPFENDWHVNARPWPKSQTSQRFRQNLRRAHSWPCQGTCRCTHGFHRQWTP